MSGLISSFPVNQQPQSLLINGGFNFFQRTPPTTATLVADDVYGPDRWYVLSQSNPVTVEKSTGTGGAVDAVKVIQANASVQRFGIAQIVEKYDSVPRRGKQVRFQGQVKVTTSQPIRYAILEWTGTADSVTSDVVNSWTNSTYTAGQFFLASSLTVAAVGTITPSGSTWTPFGLNANISASCNNLIVMVWTEGTAAQSFEFEMTQMGLYDGGEQRPWLPRSIGDERMACMRYFEKTYAQDTAPGTAIAFPGICLFQTRTAINASVSGALNQSWAFKVAKRTTPTCVIYSPQISTPNAIRNASAGTDRTGVTAGDVMELGIGKLVVDATSANAIALDALTAFHFTAAAEL